MPETLWVSDRFRKPMPVFYVTPKVADPRVEDIAQRVFPEEQITQNPHAPSIFVVKP